MELEDILRLCQAYGVTSFKSKDYDLELTNLGFSEIDYEDSDEDGFEIDINELKVLENN